MSFSSYLKQSACWLAIGGVLVTGGIKLEQGMNRNGFLVALYAKGYQSADCPPGICVTAPTLESDAFTPVAKITDDPFPSTGITVKLLRDKKDPMAKMIVDYAKTPDHDAIKIEY
jgi:hypothetical protein